MKSRKRKQRSANEKRRRAARKCLSLNMEKLGDRVMLAADVFGELIDSKETPAEIMIEASGKSEANETTKDTANSKAKLVSAKTPMAKPGEYKRVSWMGNPVAEKAKSTVETEDTTEFPMSEWTPGVKPTLQIKAFDGKTIEVEQKEKSDLLHVNLEQFEGLERLEEGLVDEILAERTIETERYEKYEKENILDGFDKPASFMEEIAGQAHSENMAKGSVIGYGMASNL